MSALSKITKDALTVLKNKIVEGLKTDGLKWFKSFKGIGSPANALTQKNYKGINFWALGINKKENNYATIYYATKKAWQSVGATIKDGQSQNGTAIFYYGVFKKSVKNNKTFIFGFNSLVICSTPRFFYFFKCICFHILPFVKLS